jgi:hypothetical protein
MTTPINPTSGAPIQRPTTDKSKPQTTDSSSSDKFTVSTDTVQTQGNLSFGSLRPLINTQLTSQTAASTAQQAGQQLKGQSLPVVNNRPHVVSNLIDTLQGQGNTQG